ncbi:hypothetical protein PINS_up022347, partial [Pythium insidiosum]
MDGASMCVGVVCHHGKCVTRTLSTTSVAVCECEALYSGSQCGVRSGLAYFEVPLAALAIFGLLLMGLRVTETSLSWLRLAESKQDFFAFPRT